MKDIDFIGKRRVFGTTSFLLVIASIIFVALNGVPKNVDFAGGSKLTVAFQDADLTIASLRERVTVIEPSATLFSADPNLPVYTIKIKKSEGGENESNISLDRLNGLKRVFASFHDEEREVLALLQKADDAALKAKLIAINPYGLSGASGAIEGSYGPLAQRLTAAAGGATNVAELARTADPDQADHLERAILQMYPAINQSTANLLGAILKRDNPLNRAAEADYNDLARQIAAVREANGDFITDWPTLTSALKVGEGEDAAALNVYLQSNFYLGKYRILSQSSFSPSIAAELLQKAEGAILLALFGILVYVAMRFSTGYAVASVVALAHDVIISLAVFALFGRELSNPVIAAFLTIVGYSLNDTIVVFDRIRENLEATKTTDIPGFMNRSINQTLSRTVVTSMTTLFVVVVIFFFSNNATLSDFAFPLLVGILVGTYSSIFVASPTLLLWHQRVRPIL